MYAAAEPRVTVVDARASANGLGGSGAPEAWEQWEVLGLFLVDLSYGAA
jgi:hypothetical protein